MNNANKVFSMLALGAAILVGILIVLNWITLNAVAPLNLIVAQIQAPLGIVMLGLSAVLIALFFIAYLKIQVGTLLETRRLLKEIQHAHDLADKAEASRVENLHQLVATEFRLLDQRLCSIAEWANPPSQDQEGKPLSLTEIVTRNKQS